MNVLRKTGLKKESTNKAILVFFLWGAILLLAGCSPELDAPKDFVARPTAAAEPPTPAADNAAVSYALELAAFLYIL